MNACTLSVYYDMDGVRTVQYGWGVNVVGRMGDWMGSDAKGWWRDMCGIYFEMGITQIWEILHLLANLSIIFYDLYSVGGLNFPQIQMKYVGYHMPNFINLHIKLMIIVKILS